MPKFFCDYCDVYLTHDSMSVRKAHNCGRNHLRNVEDYYLNIGQEQAQKVIDSITDSYHAEGQAASNPLLHPTQPAMPMGMFPNFPPPAGLPPNFPTLPQGMMPPAPGFPNGMPPPPQGMPPLPQGMPPGPPPSTGFPPGPATGAPPPSQYGRPGSAGRPHSSGNRNMYAPPRGPPGAPPGMPPYQGR